MRATLDRPHLVINADDFGLCADANAGIIAAIEAGGLRSVSMMVNTPAFDDAVSFTRRARHDIGVGLHLNLTYGPPLTPARSLVDRSTGRFMHRKPMLRAALAGRIDPADVEAECTAQLERLRATGITPTHLDGHHHVQVLPGVRDAVARCAASAGVRFIRRPAELRLDAWRPWRRVPTRAAFAWWSAGCRWPSTVRSADRFVGLTFNGPHDFAIGLRRVIDSLRPGVTELMVHPVGIDGQVAALVEEAQRRAGGDARYRLTHFGEVALQ